MNLEQDVMAEMKEAMKSKNEAALRGLRAIKSEIIKAKTEPGANGELTDDTAVKMLQKMLKQRKDFHLKFSVRKTVKTLRKEEEEEIAVIEKFLCLHKMNEADLMEALKTIIAQVGASSPADMGKVMGVATKQLAGKADGKSISTTVKELLSNK